jgi:hypothetical protein
MRSRDTAPDAHRVQLEAYRQMGPARRVQLAIEMSERAREIAIEGTLARSPGMSREEARERVLRQILGDALFEAAAASRRLS